MAVLWECIMREPYSATEGTRLPLKTLFSYCPEISSESRYFWRPHYDLLIWKNLICFSPRKLVGRFGWRSLWNARE